MDRSSNAVSESSAEADFTETWSFAAVSSGCRACEEQDRNPFSANRQDRKGTPFNAELSRHGGTLDRF